MISENMNYIGKVNHFYERIVSYYYSSKRVHFLPNEKKYRWRFLPKEVYLAMLKKSLTGVMSRMAICEEISKSEDDYFEIVKSAEGITEWMNIIEGNSLADVEIYKILDRYFTNKCEIKLNIYMITAFLFFNEYSTINKTFDDDQIKILYYLIMKDENEVTKEICDIFKQELNNCNSKDGGKKEIKKIWTDLLDRYYTYVKEIFNERVDATWKLALDENKKEIETQLDAKISYASGTNAKKELLKGLE